MPTKIYLIYADGEQVSESYLEEDYDRAMQFVLIIHPKSKITTEIIDLLK